MCYIWASLFLNFPETVWYTHLHENAVENLASLCLRKKFMSLLQFKALSPRSNSIYESKSWSLLFFFHSTVCKWQQERRGRKSIRVSTAVMPINSEFLCEWTVESGPGLMDKQCPGAWFSWALKAKTQLHSIIAFPKVFLSSIWAECKVVKGSSTKKLPIRHYFHLINKSRRRGHSAFGDKVQINKQLFAHVNIIIILSNVLPSKQKHCSVYIIVLFYIILTLLIASWTLAVWNVNENMHFLFV